MSPGAASTATTAPSATPGDLADRGQDLAQLDPEAADLHLIVDPAAEVELAARQPAGHVAGPVQAAGAERVRR